MWYLRLPAIDGIGSVPLSLPAIHLYNCPLAWLTVFCYGVRPGIPIVKVRWTLQFATYRWLFFRKVQS